MKKKGFTLIELLAVIVVLAIIALIATPIVMNVIKKANEGAAERSADNYLKAVDTLIATEKLDGTPLVDGEYTINTDGKLKKDGKEYEVEVSGRKPVGGTVKIENGQVVKGDTKIDYTDYTVKYPSGKAEASEKETNKTFTLADCDFVSGTEKTVGAKYTCELGDGVSRTFYVLEDGSNPVSGSTLTTNQIALIMDSNYDNTKQAWCASGSDNSCNADGLTVKLNEIKTAWSKLDANQIDLPTANQVLAPDGYVIDTYSYGEMNNTWLYEHLKNDVQGYWTKTSHNDDNTKAWFMNGGMNRLCDDVVSYDYYGVRPIIILSK